MPTALERLKIYIGTLMQTMAKFHAFLNQVNTAHNGLVTDHNTLVRLHNLNVGAMQARIDRITEYLELPWYKRAFVRFPLRLKQEEKAERKDEIGQSGQFTGETPGLEPITTEIKPGESTELPAEKDVTVERPRMILPGDPGWPVG
jgi:hypothetical protein